MASANTCAWERGNDGICDICGKHGIISYLWYYPTFMNGDAELQMTACTKDHNPEKNKAYQKLKNEIGPSDKEREDQGKANQYAAISDDRVRDDHLAMDIQSNAKMMFIRFVLMENWIFTLKVGDIMI